MRRFSADAALSSVTINHGRTKRSTWLLLHQPTPSLKVSLVFVSTAIYLTHTGCPIADPNTAQRVGSGPVKGLMLLQDTQLIETLTHFNRERIPERVVHASAVGAWGEFEVTHDNSDITSADWLNGVGKKCKVLARISTVGAERGGAETVRDVRGFSLKIFTDEGNQDFVFNSMVSPGWHTSN